MLTPVDSIVVMMRKVQNEDTHTHDNTEIGLLLGSW